VAHGLGDGLAGATVAASPSVALVGSYELLMMIIRSAADLLSNQRSARETQDLRMRARCDELAGRSRDSVTGAWTRRGRPCMDRLSRREDIAVLWCGGDRAYP
jgi:hypothetical protein